MDRVALALLVATACTSHETSEGPASPEVRAEGMRSEVTPASTAWVWRADRVEPADASYLLGVVGQGGLSHCPGGGYDQQWLGVYPTIGRVSVSGPADAVFDSVMERPVLAVGSPEPAPSRQSVEGPVQPCGMQMRSDWRQTPRGMMVDRAPSPGIDHFEVTAIRSLHELTARLDADHVVVTLLNPVPVALRQVELRVHYEGCFGKPGTLFETTEIGELAVGALASARVTQLASRAEARPGRQSFRAFSVQLVAVGEGVVIDLDVLLRDLGAVVECPR